MFHFLEPEVRDVRLSGGNMRHYQKYSNVMNYLKSLNITNACFFKNRDAFLNLNIDKQKHVVKTMGLDPNLTYPI